MFIKQLKTSVSASNDADAGTHSLFSEKKYCYTLFRPTTFDVGRPRDVGCPLFFNPSLIILVLINTRLDILQGQDLIREVKKLPTEMSANHNFGKWTKDKQTDKKKKEIQTKRGGKL